MRVVAVTGGIASGKSTVLGILAEKSFPVIDADKLVAEIYASGEISEFLQREFGSSEKEKIAAAAFSSRGKMKKLESVIHPVVEKKVAEKLSELREQHAEIVFIEVPVFFESEPKTSFDAIVTVYCSREKQEERLVARGVSESEAIKRINVQIPIEVKAEKADFVLDNSGSLEKTRKEAERLIEWLEGKNGC